MCRNNLVAAESVLSQLQATPNLSQDLLFSISVFEIDLQARQGDYSKALEILEVSASRPNYEEGDIIHRIKLMTLKARIYEKAGTPQKGFSIAIRAASLAHRAKALPALWDAVGAVCAVLVSLREYEGAVRMLASILPQVLEFEDYVLVAQTFSILVDAHVGLAGQATPGSLQRKEHLIKALEYIGRSFDAYSRTEDVTGQSEMMAKKATIMHLNGDSMLANDCATKYLDLKSAATEQL